MHHIVSTSKSFKILTVLLLLTILFPEVLSMFIKNHADENAAVIEKNNQTFINSISQLKLIVILIVFATLITVLILFLIIFRNHQTDVKKQNNANNTKKTHKQTLLTESERGKRELIKASESPVKDFRPNLKLENSLKIEQLKSGTRTKKELYELFAEFEKEPNLDSKINKRSYKKRDKFESREFDNPELLEQITDILKNNKVEDLLFFVLEIINLGFIKSLIGFLNYKNEFLGKDKLIDVLHKLKEQGKLKDDLLKEYVSRLLK